ncbi:MAG: hypothetical protein AAGK04_11090, partial [Planctomycetota bacterium]
MGRHKLQLYTKDGATNGPDLLADEINPRIRNAADVPTSQQAETGSTKATVGVMIDPADVVVLPADQRD